MSMIFLSLLFEAMQLMVFF